MSLPLQYHITLFLAIFEMFCFSGFFYGWAAMVYVLKAEGYFSHLCQINNTLTDQNRTNICDPQDAIFNLLYSLGSFTTFTYVLPAGIVLDIYGTRFTRIINQ